MAVALAVLELKKGARSEAEQLKEDMVKLAFFLGETERNFEVVYIDQRDRQGFLYIQNIRCELKRRFSYRLVLFSIINERNLLLLLHAPR